MLSVIIRSGVIGVSPRQRGFRILRKDECAVFLISADGFVEPSGSVHTMAWQLFRYLYEELISLFYLLLSFLHIYNHLFRPAWIQFNVFNAK